MSKEKGATAPGVREPDLHGYAGVCFPDFDERATYVEAVTTDHASAVEILKDQAGASWPGQPTLQRVHMSWVTEYDPDGLYDGGSYELPCWYGCDESEPGAVPFWKDGEATSANETRGDSLDSNEETPRPWLDDFNAMLEAGQTVIANRKDRG